MINKMYRNLGILLLILAVIFLFSCENKNELLYEEGISKELANYRKQNIENVNYDLFFNIPENVSDSIDARLILGFDFKNQVADLILDFNAEPKLIKQITISNQPIDFEIQNEHIIIPSKWLNKSNLINVDFVAGNQSLNRHDDFMYTLFVPERASTCFPLLDQPDIKASYQLSMNVPKKWTAISNTNEEIIEEKDTHRFYLFKKTKKISSYLFAFAVGQFDTIERKVNGRMMRMFHRETDSTKLANNIDEIFKWHSISLDWLEEYTKLKYPFEKFDFVLIPSFQYGGMEHPGSVFYKSSSLILNESSTINQQMGRGRLIAHETAHMWFGDLVTMPWFDDVWLKEVFANFMASKIIRPIFGDVNHDLQFLMAHYPAAYEVDRTEGTHPIAQSLENLKNAGSLYGSIIYQKAPIVMRMLEEKIGKEAFRKGLIRYLEENKFGNASWDDLIKILGEQSGTDLQEWNNSWVKSDKMPTIKCGLNSKKGRLLVISAGQNENFYPQNIDIALTKGDSLQIVSAKINEKVTKIKKDTFINAEYTYANYGGMGYGYFPMGSASQEFYLSNIDKVESTLVRGSLWINFYESVVRGKISPNKMMNTMIKAISKEKEPLIVDYLNGRIEKIFWKFLNEDQRDSISSKLEGVLFNMAVNSANEQLKSSFFKTFYKTAITKQSIDILYEIWNDDESEQFSLSESDYIDLAYELALRKEDQAAMILDTQLHRIDNEDRKRRFKWVMTSLSINVNDRDAFFENLKSPENRENEEWVIESMKYLNHPLRQEHSVKYILPSLEMLREIKITGDIFFPKRWLESTFWGHQSSEAADIVRQFLYKNHDYPNDLKNKILQSSDLLFRAESVQSAGINKDKSQ